VDTISEDLDLAYRAQLAGWQLAYDDTSLASAELPNRMLVYKQQQFYWAKGGMQVSRKLLGQLLGASISWVKKVDALLFTTWPVHHLLLVLLLLLRLPQLLWPTPLTIYLDAFICVGLLGVIVPSLVDWWQGKNRVPLQLVLQVGVAPNNTYGILAGIFGSWDGYRTRTPKAGDTPAQSAYLIAPDWIILIELGLTLAALAGVLFALVQHQWLALPLLLLYLLGLGWVSGQSAWEGLQWYRGRRVRAGTTKDSLFPLPLTAFEEFLLCDDRPAYPMTAMYRLQFAGFLEPVAFRAAVEMVIQRHPLLRATVRRPRFGRPVWVEHPNWQPVIQWQPQTSHPGGFPQLVHFNLAQEPGIRWWVLARDDGHDVIIQVQHCCSDGAGGNLIVEDLLVAYILNLGMKDGDVSLRPLDPQRLLRRGAPKLAAGMSLKSTAGQLMGAVGVYEFLSRSPVPLVGKNHPFNSSPTPPDLVSRVQITEFEPDETKNIRAAAKSRRVTLNMLLLHDLFLALGTWRQRWSIGSSQDWLRIGLPIDLRGGADKALPVCNSISMIFLDRRAGTFKDDNHLLAGIYNQLWRIKRFQLQYTYLLTLGAARLLPGLLSRLTRADKCHATTYLS
ncbi:MAG TPA: hypothetical protein VGD99_20990, partial [Anaerolineae bacterium]